jgi:hypothetical protein
MGRMVLQKGKIAVDNKGFSTLSTGFSTGVKIFKQGWKYAFWFT